MSEEWKEYGGYKDDQGNVRVGVDDATLENETGLWVAGKIGLAVDSLEEALQNQMAVSGNQEFENNMGRVQTAWPKDVGKKVWIRVRGKPEGWAGPYVIIKAADPELIYQWRKEGKIVEVSRNVGDQLDISENGVMGEMAWMQEPPPAGAGEAKNESHPIGLGALGTPKAGPGAGIRANFAPRLEQMPPGASMPLMQAATGLSAQAISMGGRTDMRIGGNPVESAVAAVREARQGWVTDTFNPLVRNRSLPGLDWPRTSSFGELPSARGPAAQDDDTFFASYEEGRTGDLNKLYELQMAGMPQSAITEYAQANGLSFEEAVNALHASAAVDDRWATDLPWFYDIQDYGPGQGEAMDIADAARAIGVDVDNIPLDELLYSTEAKGGEFGEGSEEHWKHDSQVGWTNESFGMWTARRAWLAGSTDDDGNLYWPPGTISYDQSTYEKFMSGQETATMTDSQRGEWSGDGAGTSSVAYVGGEGPGMSWMTGRGPGDQQSPLFDWDTGQTVRDKEFGELRNALLAAEASGGGGSGGGGDTGTPLPGETYETSQAWRPPSGFYAALTSEEQAMTGHTTVQSLFEAQYGDDAAQAWAEQAQQAWAENVSQGTVPDNKPVQSVAQPQSGQSRAEKEAYQHGLTKDEWERSWERQEERRQEESGTDALNVHGLTADEWKRSWDNPNRET